MARRESSTIEAAHIVGRESGGSYHASSVPSFAHIKITGKIRILYIFVFTFTDTRWKKSEQNSRYYSPNLICF
jgi:hypothetical protein